MNSMSLFSLLSLLILTACSQEPRPVQFGEAACDHCRMVIMDDRFVTQLVTEKGKAYLFDSIECLSSFVNAKPALEPEAELWVGSYVDPGEWINVEEARFLHHPDINSPMGQSLLAISQGDSGQIESSLPGAVSYTWEEIRILTRQMQHEEEEPYKSASSVSVKPDDMINGSTHTVH